MIALWVAYYVQSSADCYRVGGGHTHDIQTFIATNSIAALRHTKKAINENA